jgi:hypothetical protein
MRGCHIQVGIANTPKNSEMLLGRRCVVEGRPTTGVGWTNAQGVARLAPRVMEHCSYTPRSPKKIPILPSIIEASKLELYIVVLKNFVKRSKPAALLGRWIRKPNAPF